MLADSVKNTSAARPARPGALRDLKRDWQSWSLGEKFALAMITALSLLALVR